MEKEEWNRERESNGFLNSIIVTLHNTLSIKAQQNPQIEDILSTNHSACQSNIPAAHREGWREQARGGPWNER